MWFFCWMPANINLMNKSRGFTLIELLVVLAISAILMALATPSFKNLIQSNTISSNVNTFLADARFARSEAIRRGGTVVMCRSDAPEAISPTCSSVSSAGTNGWASGWIIFHDLNNSGQINGTEIPLRVQAPITALGSIAEGTSGTSTLLKFTATGRLQSLPSGSSPLQLTFGDSNYASDVQRIVCMGLGGRARIGAKGSTSCAGA